MCGIAGIFHYGAPERAVDRRVLEQMTRALAHRGPDGEGIHVSGPLGLGHRRLAIVDLSPTGAQPMTNEDRSLWISYNGEFYNHGEFRQQLVQRHTFRGSSDAETLLHLFEERGVDCLREIAGIFGLAVWDERQQRLTLARDPLGVKQVYYHDDGRRLVFASEVKALLCCDDVPRQVDPQAVNEYLHFHTPLFDRTFFRHIRQLRPGELLDVSRVGVRRKTYWRLTDFSQLGGSPEENIADLRERLETVVSDQLMADVPVGAFFSGGIDSTTAAAYAKRAGRPPRCFGVHFANQGVADERPYQEAAAKALGLELDLMTLDGSTFPDDVERLIYQQDEPVIGAAMIPMYYVSKLASQRVKVCLGGQGADEIFAGYARYALAQPWLILRSWFAGRGRKSNQDGSASAAVGGNLLHDLADPATWQRLARNGKHLLNWKARCFANYAKVPERDWRGVLGDDELLSREECWGIFEDSLDKSGAVDPADKLMHWDVQTYLTGLFQQDDRMSMAHGLESRVPLADPRLVEFAFRLPFDLKFRAGATKWILREAVADVIPADVLNRRKVGFATPAETWMRSTHAGFVREILLSSRARQRGFWNPRGLERVLSQPRHPFWFDILWKALCVESWARSFLDANVSAQPASPLHSVESESLPEIAPDPAEAEPPLPEIAADPAQSEPARQSPPASLDENRPEPHSIRHLWREARDLGFRGTVFRVGWEAKLRSGMLERRERAPGPLPLEVEQRVAQALLERPIFDLSVGDLVADRVTRPRIAELTSSAELDCRGRILCFGRWLGNFGDPIDWQLNPQNRRRWDSRAHWTGAIRDEDRVGDIKLTWEVARFPQAYRMARAAAFSPRLRTPMAEALVSQIRGFIEANPYGRGIHWASGQEIGIRVLAWIFAASVLRGEPSMESAAPSIARSIHQQLAHVARYFDYTLNAVYNNHLIADAVALLWGGALFPELPGARDWYARALAVLEQEADAQFYADGGQFQDSHNYHRVVMDYYLWAAALLRAQGTPFPESWRKRMETSLDFLFGHQNPTDGRLPNYGPNDGAQPFITSTCDFSDFRPLLQALSVVTRGERLYEPGPWDEAIVWLLGPKAIEVPLRKRAQRSISLAESGHHVLRGDQPSSFAALRCGSLKQRFSQIDMLSLDVWWRGQNVIVDGGTYLFNGSDKWHRHFARTQSHNTVQVDGLDQMLHYRRFKNLYWTEAKLLGFENTDSWVLCEGEHYGFQRRIGCVHRRSVLFVKDDLWVVLDWLGGRGDHDVRLHWLAGDFPHQYLARQGKLILKTPQGPFCLAVMDQSAVPVVGEVVEGRNDPPRGWMSRYYGERVPVPSLQVRSRATLPSLLVTILTSGEAVASAASGQWRIQTDEAEVTFSVNQGRFANIGVARARRLARASI